MNSTLSTYLKWPLIVSLLGIVLAAILGGYATQSTAEHMSFVMTAILLAALEISLSFDNAIVNANRLDRMTEIWRRRFLTWGILIAVFGMRIVFPLAIVSIAAWIGPLDALKLAVLDPATYAEVIQDAHISISAFGGVFLILVALSFFLDPDKKVHWVTPLERSLCKCGRIQGFETVFVLAVVLGFSALLPDALGHRFVFGAVLGMFAFMIVNALAQVLDDTNNLGVKSAARGGIGAFMYLEIIDASFSFDGVIGAFALTTNLFLIAIGLGIGAMYVRAMTIMIVEKQTLARFQYLEHGAFYSVFVLAAALLLQSIMHVPEILTGLAGVGLIGLGLYCSIRRNARRA